MYRGKSQPKDANYHSRSSWHPLGKDFSPFYEPNSGLQDSQKSFPSVAKYRCFNLVIDTGRASPDTVTALSGNASIAPKTDIWLQKASIARMRDGTFYMKNLCDRSAIDRQRVISSVSQYSSFYSK
ncbi:MULTISPECIES: hypothetical protein [unclassified Microcoleus]|uniref:hypothetical protein n=1 Tax=unclassified Microcoleus TaxID=2642155 RepID=UPI002FD3DC67